MMMTFLTESNRKMRAKIKSMSPKKMHNPAFEKFDFTSVTLQVIQPTLTSSNHKMLWLLFFEETRDNFIKSGLITENKFNEMLEGIKEIVNDENSYILPMRNFQINGKKK